MWDLTPQNNIISCIDNEIQETNTNCCLQNIHILSWHKKKQNLEAKANQIQDSEHRCFTITSSTVTITETTALWSYNFGALGVEVHSPLSSCCCQSFLLLSSKLSALLWNPSRWTRARSLPLSSSFVNTTQPWYWQVPHTTEGKT